MSKYSVQKVRRFTGHEGPGYNAELLRDGVVIATVIDQGDGGDVHCQWINRDRVPCKVACAVNGTANINLCVEEAALYEHLRGQQDEIAGEMHPKTTYSYMWELINDYAEMQAMKRRCRIHTCYRLAGQKKGEYMSMAIVFSPDIAERLRKQYGDKLETVYNEQFVKEARHG